MILERLATGERTVGALVESVGASQPLVSKHLRVLREAGLVRVRVEAQRRLYSLDAGPSGGLAEFDRWLDGLRTAWADRLNALETFLDDDGPSEASRKDQTRETES